MRRKDKVLPQIKLKAIEDYLEITIRITETAIQLSVIKSIIEYWVLKYKTLGAEGLITTSKNNYCEDLKFKAISD